MGQHKNSAQVDIFIKFLEQHQDLARGFVKGDRVYCEHLWTELVTQLYASGPPTKDVPAWKKVWVDMKLSVKHRMAHNKAECGKTGGGRFNKYVLSPTDEQVPVICGLYTSVEGIRDAKSFGAPCNENPTPTKKIAPPKKNNSLDSIEPCDEIIENLTPTKKIAPPKKNKSLDSIEPCDEIIENLTPNKKIAPPKKNKSLVSIEPCDKIIENLTPIKKIAPPKKNNSLNSIEPCDEIIDFHTSISPSSSSVQLCQNENTVSIPIRPTQVSNRKRKRDITDVGDVMKMEAEHFSKIATNLDNIKSEIKENRSYLKEISRNIREIKKIKEKEFKELTRHNYALEKSVQTKNELKLKFLELERLKLGLE